MPDFNRSRQVWHDHIARWGGGVNNGYLVRDGSRRAATMAISQYAPSEREKIIVDHQVRFMISALNVSAANVPDPELDTIEFKKKRYKILMVPEGAQPDGTWIAFDTPAVFVESV